MDKDIKFTLKVGKCIFKGVDNYNYGPDEVLPEAAFSGISNSRLDTFIGNGCLIKELPAEKVEKKVRKTTSETGKKKKEEIK